MGIPNDLEQKIIFWYLQSRLSIYSSIAILVIPNVIELLLYDFEYSINNIEMLKMSSYDTIHNIHTLSYSILQSKD